MDILTPSNTVHIFWQIPQYILLTMGEIMFSITGLAFAFTQASVNSIIFKSKNQVMTCPIKERINSEQGIYIRKWLVKRSGKIEEG